MQQPIGGTELLRKWLYEFADLSLLEQFNIVSRPDEYKAGARNILWVHDLPADMPFLSVPANRNMFEGIVFVSAWQQTVFFMNLGVQYSESIIIRNAITPIAPSKPDDGVIRLIYHPTPHRGLEILVQGFEELCCRYDNLHLDVFSNFDIYARPELNNSYNHIYERCMANERITYHGTQSNETVRQFLAEADIFSYPCIWRETSCLSAIEAMSAECLIVAPDYAALSETVGQFGIFYPWTNNDRDHINRFVDSMSIAIEAIRDKSMVDRLKKQKTYADMFYSWDTRISEWNKYLLGLLNQQPKLQRGALTWN